jgi:hypothetical protein
MSASAPPVPPGTGFAGPAWFYTDTGFNALSFLVDQIIDGKAFAALVEVMAVKDGGVGSPPIVAVQPMVSQADGLGNLTPHGTVYNLPCFRLQGGAGAVILDPVVGDIGQAIICHRDISTVKNTRAIAGPGSNRKNSWSDGCYFGSFLGAAPTNYVQITQDGINIVSLGTINITAENIILNGVDWSSHVHGGVIPGGGDTGPPV